jgi:hypothetical protein
MSQTEVSCVLRSDSERELAAVVESMRDKWTPGWQPELHPVTAVHVYSGSEYSRYVYMCMEPTSTEEPPFVPNPRRYVESMRTEFGLIPFDEWCLIKPPKRGKHEISVRADAKTRRALEDLLGAFRSCGLGVIWRSETFAMHPGNIWRRLYLFR